MQVEETFFFEYVKTLPEEGIVSSSAPSNIALIKYWGKKDLQIPENPSISFTLENCRTHTKISFRRKNTPSSTFEYDLFFEGLQREDFKPKIDAFLKNAYPFLPFLNAYTFKIETQNTFPHSSGIASSASSMCALASCFINIERMMVANIPEEIFLKKISFLARLGSGSASRSVEGPVCIWGKHQKVAGTSDQFAIKFPETLHPCFKQYQDTILLVDQGEKLVSSSVGHNLMNGHPFAEKRFQEAPNNLLSLVRILKSGDLDGFIKLVEHEALTLHAMMMTSMPYFILMKPNTLKIINAIWEFRKKTDTKVCFTLDAGANVHVLYPLSEKKQVLGFIMNELVVYCQEQRYICDTIGFGIKES